MAATRRAFLGLVPGLVTLPQVANLRASEPPPPASSCEMLPAADATLQEALRRSVVDLGLRPDLDSGRMAVALLDLSRPDKLRYAGLNDHAMLYAASLPKIAILIAGFERIQEGLLRYTPAVREMFTRLTRFSSNVDASRAIQTIGFEYIARTLRKYRFYDPQENGGLWLGKGYGGPNDRWKRDPLHNLSHGATAAQTARFFWLVEEGRLISQQASAEIKKILSAPGIRHKFVAGLADVPGRSIYRKSGTWRNYHADGALVEAGEYRYVAVALLEREGGGALFPPLIRSIDRMICGGAA
ncbi:MAG: serine hydrolase [Acidobacteria bacterium]|nr:serine hydrolase [Acidobacteriota bacterium]